MESGVKKHKSHNREMSIHHYLLVSGSIYCYIHAVSVKFVLVVVYHLQTRHKWSAHRRKLETQLIIPRL